MSRENGCVPCTEQSDSPVLEIPLCRALGEVLLRMTQEFTSGLLEQGQALALLCGAPRPCAEGRAHLARVSSQGSCVSSSLGREGWRCFADLAPDRTESFVEAAARGAGCLRLAWLRQESENAAIQIHTEDRKVTALNM